MKLMKAYLQALTLCLARVAVLLQGQDGRIRAPKDDKDL